MLETLNKLMLAGLGAIEMTRETAEKTFDEMVQRGQAKRENRPAFVKDLMESVAKTRRETQDFIDRQVRETVDRLNLAGKDDIRRIEAKLDELLAQKRQTKADPTKK